MSCVDRPQHVGQVFLGVHQRRLVGCEEAEERPLSQRRLAPGHRDRDPVDVLHVVGRIAPGQHRLPGVGEHLGELEHRRQVRRHVVDQAQRHDIINVVQRVAYPGRQAGVAAARRAPLAGFGVHEVGAGGAGAVVDLVGHDLHPVPAVAAPDGEGARGRGDGILDDVRGDAHAGALHPRAGARQQIARLGVVHVDAGAVQALQRGLIHPLDLPVGEDPKLRGLQGRIVGVHRFVFVRCLIL